MKPHRISTLRRRALRSGYSLTEVVVALGLVLTTALPMLGVLSIGLNDSRAAVEHRVLESVRTSIRTRLQAPGWPSEATGAWTASRWFTATGAETGSEKGKTSVIEARMTGGPGFGFASASLEAVHVEFVSVTSGKVLAECSVQRTR